MSKYKFVEGCREISGFGGGYEDMCRKMVIRGMEWFDENPSANPKFKQYENVFGIINEENPAAKSLTDAMLEASANDCTAGMMQASVNHTLFAAKNGWEKYIEEMTKPRN
jgi:hypothetical protein